MIEPVAGQLGPEALAAALAALPDGVAIVDADGTLCYLNPAGAALLRRDPADLVGRRLPDDLGRTARSLLLRARRAGAPVTVTGPFPPAGRSLTATALLRGGLLQVSFRPAADPPDASPGGARDDGTAAGEWDRLRFLAEVSETMIATLDTGESAAQLAALAVSRLCDWAVVALVGERGRPGKQAWAHRDPARRADLDTYLRGRLRNTGDDVAVIEALQSGEAVQVTPREELVAPSLPNDEVRAAWRRLAAASTTIVPLRARGGTFGALAMVNAAGRPPLTRTQIATATEVARRGALALDNARLYGQQLKVAETLQRSLLTPPLQLADLQVAVRYRPAEAHQQVGGDWYDAFGQPDGGALLVIGDVVGHNVDAAAAMGQIRSILRGTAYDRPDDPAQVLTRVDEVLTGLEIGTMATALVARLDPPAAAPGSASRVLCWSSAGHLPALVLTAEGSVQTLHAAPDRLLGAGQSRRRATHNAVLHPGDVLVFYTDGLVEHGRTGLDEGITRLTRTLAGLAGVDLETLCDQLLDRIVTGRADDDIAILAVRCCPPESAPAR